MYTAIIFFILNAISYQTSINDRCTDFPEGLKSFLNDFELAVQNHDSKTVMQCMDSDYKTNQHDNFLRGNIRQFLDEFFCGNLAGKEGFECIPFNDITRLERLDISMDDGMITVRYMVVSGKSTIEAECYVTISTVNNDIVYGMASAVG